MHRYFLKIPWWVRAIFPHYLWRMPTEEKNIYLTFDDGPHPTITPWVLDELDKFGAKATFFFIGENVRRFPAVYDAVLARGHSVGNHTHRHLNGWKTSTQDYVADAREAGKLIAGDLFRPPYGRIRRRQARALLEAFSPKKIRVVMWTVLSGDFDKNYTAELCAKNVLERVSSGSIVVFHDSEKAEGNLKGSLPVVLNGLKKAGYAFEKIAMDGL